MLSLANVAAADQLFAHLAFAHSALVHSVVARFIVEHVVVTNLASANLAIQKFVLDSWGGELRGDRVAPELVVRGWATHWSLHSQYEE